MSITISIITPSFNQAAFVEKCLDSIASQTVAPIQHVILDPGSTDVTREILSRYAQQHSFVELVLEADEGQADAINKGFRRATGDIVTWLNTDDFYANKSVLDLVCRVFEEHPDVDVVHGCGAFLDESGALLREAFVANATEREFRHRFLNSVGILQPTTFYRRSLLERVGLLDTRFNCAFDYEFWVRFVMGGAKFHFIDAEIAKASFHDAAKSTSLRSQQLHESALITKHHYGFASGEWIKRAVECDVAGRNGIFDKGEIPKSLHPFISEVSRLRFFHANNDARARAALIRAAPTGATRYSRQLATQSGLVNCSRIIVTTFDEHYFEQGLTLIASIHRNVSSDTMILVYDLLLPADKRIQLESLDNVVVVPYPIDDVNSYPDYLSPKNYGYKCGAMWDARRFVDDNGVVLWIDAGVTVVQSLEPLFELIAREGAFFVDHDDKEGAWPFYNATFTHPVALERMGATREEMLGLHVCSCLMGYLVGGRFEKLFEDARNCARDRKIVVHDKHLVPGKQDKYGVVLKDPTCLLLKRYFEKRRDMEKASAQEVKEAFGFLGHRQDQSIISLLVARYKAPINSAQKYCISDVGSARASKLNWENGKVSKEYSVSNVIPAHALKSLTYHHRGTYSSVTGLRYGLPERDVWVVLDDNDANSVDIRSIAGSEFPLATISADSLPSKASLEHASISAIASNSIDVDALKQMLDASSAKRGNTLVLSSAVYKRISRSCTSREMLDQGKLRKYCSLFEGVSSDHPLETLITLALLGCRKLVLVGKLFEMLGQRECAGIRAAVRSMKVEWEICDAGAIASDAGIVRAGIVRKDMPGQLPAIDGQSVVTIFYPTLRTEEERSFWRNFIAILKDRGYSPVVISFLWGTQQLNIAGNCILDCPRIYIPGPLQIGGMKDFRGFGNDGERLRLFMKEAVRKLSREAIVEMMCQEAKPPLMSGGQINRYDRRFAVFSAGISAYIDYLLFLLQSLNPKKIIVNNDTYPLHYAVRACADTLGMSAIYSERSPFVNQWFERDGYYAYSAIPSFTGGMNWVGNREMIKRGRRIMESLRESPGGHRIDTGANHAGIPKLSGSEKRILVAMDHVRATGWSINSHPTRSVNYPVFDTPSDAIRSLAAHAKSLGAKLVVKPHPSEPRETDYLKLIDEMPDVELFEGSIKAALAMADIVVTFLTKVAFVAMAWGKPVVIPAPNAAVASGLALHCKTVDEVSLAIERALSHEYTKADLDQLAAFLGALDTEYFIANDLMNLGAKRLLNEEFPECEKKCGVLQASQLNGIDMLAPQSVPGSREDPGILYGPFKRDRRRKLDEVGLVHLLYDKGVIQAREQKPVMFDVGACLGDTYIPFSKSAWEVHAFEPNPPMFAKLAANPLPNVWLNNNAVTDKGGERLPFYTSEESIGISSLLAFRNSHTQSAIVETVRLSEYCKEKGIEHIDFLKVDTEGFDLRVLQGLDWEIFRPSVVVCEFEDAKTKELGYCFTDLATFLENLGYTIFVSEWHPVTRYGAGEHAWHGLHRWPCELLNVESWGNLVAIRDTVDEREVIDSARYLLDVNQAFGQSREASSREGALVFSDANVTEVSDGKYFIPVGGSWLAHHNPVRVGRGTNVTGVLTLTVPQKCQIQVMLCRHGATPFEGKHKVVELPAGKSSVPIRASFKYAHMGVRLQISAPEMPLTVEGLGFEYKFEAQEKVAELTLSRSALPKSKFLVVLGNGPSLKGFDFKRLKSFDVIGMNAAYRYWDEIGWYPRYYVCLDKVVGLSHKEGISRLIRERAKNGIEKFLLRDNLINVLEHEISVHPCVVNFDILVEEHKIFSPMPITTGSHATLYGAYLGYQEILILGVDCNYVEEVDGSKHQGGTKLVIEKDLEENPNYFFSGYQKLGDEYTIPNPTPDLHLNSWRAVGAALSERGVKVVNCSAISRVDAFPKGDFSEFEAASITHHNTVSPYSGFRFDRAERASIDETMVISTYLDRQGKEPGLMIDVGAHIGTALQPFLDLNWKVIAFEPDETNRKSLLARLANHKYGANVVVDTRCVSNMSSTDVPFFRSGQSSGISSLSAFHDSHYEAQRVDTISLSDYFSDRELNEVAFLKIDTEGHDLFVLQGFPWDRLKPDVIECEYEDAKTVPMGHTWRDVAEFLREKGYTVYISEWHPIIRYGIAHDWRRVVPYPGVDIPSDSWGNFLAFREDPGYTAVVAAFKKLLKTRPATPTTTVSAVSTGPQIKPSSRESTISKANALFRSERYDDALAMGLSVPRTQGKTTMQVHSLQPEYATPVQRTQGLLRRVGWFYSRWPSLVAVAAIVLNTAAMTGVPFNWAFMAAGTALLLFLVGHAATSYKQTASDALAIGLKASRTADSARGIGGRAAEAATAAQQTADAATKTAGQASTTAGKVADTAEAALDEIQRVTSMTAVAQETVDKVAGTAEAALNDANKALELAESVLATVQAVSEESSSAMATATKASGTADTALSEARMIAERTEAAMETATKASGTADTALTETRTTAERTEAAVKTATKATETAETALTEAQEAFRRAKTVVETATKATETAGVALTAARTASEMAGTALATAHSASGTAGKTLNEASTATETAGTALTAARTASERAETALDSATTAKKNADSTLHVYNQFVQKSNTLNTALFQVFPRQLGTQDLDRLLEFWVPALDLKLDRKALGYLAHRICLAEDTCSGRLATTVQDALVRVLFALSVPGASLSIMEIGTLFGINLAILYETCRGRFPDVHLTAIDPLGGYYNKGAADMITQVPVNRAVFEHNMRRMDVPQEAFTLIQEFSTDNAALEAASGRKYHLLIIDGDHSYQGVKFDFDHYSPFVESGGYIIFDDYNSTDWPDVGAFVDQEIRSRSGLKYVGADWRTVAFQVVRGMPGAS